MKRGISEPESDHLLSLDLERSVEVEADRGIGPLDDEIRRLAPTEADRRGRLEIDDPLLALAVVLVLEVHEADAAEVVVGQLLLVRLDALRLGLRTLEEFLEQVLHLIRAELDGTGHGQTIDEVLKDVFGIRIHGWSFLYRATMAHSDRNEQMTSTMSKRI